MIINSGSFKIFLKNSNLYHSVTYTRFDLDSDVLEKINKMSNDNNDNLIFLNDFVRQEIEKKLNHVREKIEKYFNNKKELIDI